MEKTESGKKIYITSETTKEDLSSFRLKAPCSNCPFRKDNPHNGWLGRNRAAGIAHSVFVMGQSFHCHKTTETTDWDYEKDTYQLKGCEAQCAGAAIMQIKLGHTSAWMQVAERMGFTAEIEGIKNLDLTAPVFDSIDDFIDFHS